MKKKTDVVVKKVNVKMSCQCYNYKCYCACMSSTESSNYSTVSAHGIIDAEICAKIYYRTMK